MTLLAQDTFVRPNQSGFGQASDGTNTYVVAGGSGTYSIVSNQGQYTGDATHNDFLQCGKIKSTDTDFVFRFSLTANASDFVGAFMRYDGVGTYYRLHYGNSLLSIFRVINSGSTTLATVSFAGVSGNVYWLRCRAVGSQITATIWADGASEAETATANAVTDTFIKQAGTFGFFFSVNVGADIIKVDSLTVTDGAPTLPYPRYTPRGLGGTVIPDPVTQPLPYIDRGPLSTIIYELRTFIPRALGGTYIPDTWPFVGRGFLGTIILPMNNAMSSTDALIADDSMTAYSEGITLTDALTASDSIASQDGANLSELNTASDVGNMQQWNVDSLSVSDISSYADGTSLIENNSASDAMTGGLGSRFSDSLSTVDASFLQALYSATELLVVADALAQTDTYQPAEAQIVLESLLATDSVNWLDILSLTDTSSMVSVSGPPVGTPVSVSAYGRDGKVTAYGRDGRCIAYGRDSKVSGSGHDGKVSAYGHDGKVVARSV